MFSGKQAAMRHRPKPALATHGLCGHCRPQNTNSGVFCRNRICFSAGVTPNVRLSRWGGISKTGIRFCADRVP
jgi:hypothetical protein